MKTDQSLRRWGLGMGAETEKVGPPWNVVGNDPNKVLPARECDHRLSYWRERAVEYQWLALVDSLSLDPGQLGRLNPVLVVDKPSIRSFHANDTEYRLRKRDLVPIG